MRSDLTSADRLLLGKHGNASAVPIISHAALTDTLFRMGSSQYCKSQHLPLLEN